jgi:UDP-N-acetylglucosamine--N-acetylmuramyl-(pentapeptide) pyrophosphoryl-undecaprenol N-acetylglucosamine transferase
VTRLDDGLRVLMVVGKTGGHVYPALAVAQAFREQVKGAEIHFVCPDRRMIEEMVERAGFRTFNIRASRIMGGTWKEKLQGAANAWKGLWDARAIIRDFRPDAVIGFGSFLTPPVILAARSMGVYCAIQEQNSIPGWANRVVGPLTHMNFLSFERSRAYFPAGRVRVVGNPVRQELVRARGERVNPPSGPGSEDDRFTLLILGGSQGARFLNTRLPRVAERLLGRRKLRVIHQTGGADLAMVEKLYGGVEGVEVRDFFLDMAAVYRRTDLAICRSGAGAVFELMNMGIPALFIPFPYAASNHQFHNAAAVATHSASLIMTEDEFDERRVVEIVEGLMDKPEELEAMSRKLRALANPYAAEHIVATVLEGLGQRTRGGKAAGGQP